jgi:murein DD-endopeptidase MepM/ murein hydrolase activator NlpD
MAIGLPLRMPLDNPIITSRFGIRKDPLRHRRAMHNGIDFAVPLGEATYATASGDVTSAGYSRGYGNMVEIDHGDGLSTRFAHLSRIFVKEGQRVGGGDVIGQTGNTGRSTGPHLHYEIRLDDRPVDPMIFLSAREGTARRASKFARDTARGEAFCSSKDSPLVLILYPVIHPIEERICPSRDAPLSARVHELAFG